MNYKTKEVLKTIINWCGLIILVTLTAWFIKLGIEKDSINQCHRLEDQAINYPLFYITSYEKEMCDSYGIEINAVVK